MSSEDSKFVPALIAVDLQEDFVPPKGSLAVPNGRDVIPLINKLLTYPFVLKIGSKDAHPASHVSFASNHAVAKPFTSTATVINPFNPEETFESRLWPDHCVQGTGGAEGVAEIDAERFDRTIELGQDPRVEVLSAFYSPFKNPRVNDSGLAEQLHKAGVTDVYVAGLAADQCVKETALDALGEGFKTYLIDDASRPVNADSWEREKVDLEKHGLRIVRMEDPEVKKVAKREA